MGEGMIVAIATIGTICGAIVAGKLADRFGRKPILFWIGILFGVGALATALAPVPSLIPVRTKVRGRILFPDRLLHAVPLPRGHRCRLVFGGRTYLYR